MDDRRYWIVRQIIGSKHLGPGTLVLRRADTGGGLTPIPGERCLRRDLKVRLHGPLIRMVGSAARRHPVQPLHHHVPLALAHHRDG